jgi:RHS repeat-associated protein
MDYGEFTRTRAAGRPSAAAARWRRHDVSPATRATCAYDPPPPARLRRAGVNWRLPGTRDACGRTAKQSLRGGAEPVPMHIGVDAPVLRDENKDADGDCTDGDDERLYFCNDVNMNVVALVNDANEVVERYLYDPYGRTTVLHGVKDAAGTDTSASEWSFRGPNKFDNELGFCGYWYDFRNGFYHVRHRAYYPNRGWLQRDPLGYVDGMSLYEYVMSRPTAYVDPLGELLIYAEGAVKIGKKRDLGTTSRRAREHLHSYAKETGQEFHCAPHRRDAEMGFWGI